MADYAYQCHQCGDIFRSSAIMTQCPQCDSNQIRELPSWEPLGSDLSEIPIEWEYECQQCRNKFKLPVPASPTLEKYIRCPACYNSHIHRLTRTGFEPLYCG
jgi:DNA-directed RNA polymerase subunit RPC12/RpoP